MPGALFGSLDTQSWQPLMLSCQVPKSVIERSTQIPSQQIGKLLAWHMKIWLSAVGQMSSESSVSKIRVFNLEEVLV